MNTIAIIIAVLVVMIIMVIRAARAPATGAAGDLTPGGGPSCDPSVSTPCPLERWYPLKPHDAKLVKKCSAAGVPVPGLGPDNCTLSPDGGFSAFWDNTNNQGIVAKYDLHVPKKMVYHKSMKWLYSKKKVDKLNAEIDKLAQKLKSATLAGPTCLKDGSCKVLCDDRRPCADGKKCERKFVSLLNASKAEKRKSCPVEFDSDKKWKLYGDQGPSASKIAFMGQCRTGYCK